MWRCVHSLHGQPHAAACTAVLLLACVQAVCKPCARMPAAQEHDALQGELKLLAAERSRLARELALKADMEDAWAARAGQQAAALKEAHGRVAALEASLQQVRWQRRCERGSAAHCVGQRGSLASVVALLISHGSVALVCALTGLTRTCVTSAGAGRFRQGARVRGGGRAGAGHRRGGRRRRAAAAAAAQGARAGAAAAAGAGGAAAAQRGRGLPALQPAPGKRGGREV